MAIQAVLGSDIAMVFDDCPPHTSTPRELRAAVERTMRWAGECRDQPRAPGQMVFGIVQGGANAAMREECAKALVALKFDGYAIGGVSVGEPEPEMMRAVEMTEPLLPADQPRYASCLRGWPATARPSRARAASASRRGRAKRTSGQSKKAAIVSPASVSRARICGTCST
jgi:queuine tRNA-ribosyltransferase